MSAWISLLELDQNRKITSGSEQALCEAIGRGADLRIYTEFRHNEHIDTKSDLAEIVQEVSDFPTVYLVDQRWVAGIMTYRMPISPPDGFGPRPSMSFFMYNQNGQQAIARPHLDGRRATGAPGPSPLDDHSDMPKYHQQSAYDALTNAPSSNFIYDFECYRFFGRTDWREVFSVSSAGQPRSGSLAALVQAFTQGCEIKVAIRGLCHDLGNGPDHELFVQCGPGYYNTERKLFSVGSRPCVRVKPSVPMLYASREWDFGWLMPRTDGQVALWLCDPYSLQFRKMQNNYAVRWFVR